MDKEEWTEKNFGRWIEPNEIIFDFDDREHGFHAVNYTGIILCNTGYQFEIWFSKGGKGPHIHVKEIMDMGNLKEEQLKKYKELFLKKYCAPGYLKYLDFQTCGRHRIAVENELHWKYKTIKKLMGVWNEKKINTVDKGLQEMAKLVEKTIYEDSSAVVKGVPIEAIAKRFKLKRKGKLFYCPFHKDTEPSLSLTNEKGLYNCFGCPAAGTTQMFWKLLKQMEIKNG